MRPGGYLINLDVQWIFGGGFQLGATTMYDGTDIVTRSQQLGSPIVYVSMNYRCVILWRFPYKADVGAVRLAGLGFLPGKEVKEAGVGNLGLHDRTSIGYFLYNPFTDCIIAEREALRWIQKYITQFGGDPTKVTMYVFLFMIRDY